MKSTKLLFTCFALFLSILFSNCTKDNATIPTTTPETLIRSNWGVDYYFNTQNLTSNYGNYKILFSSTGLLVAQKDNQTVIGSWSNLMDGNNNEILDLNFNTTDANLVQLSRQWKLTNKTSTTFEFEKTEQGSQTEIFRIRRQ